MGDKAIYVPCKRCGRTRLRTYQNRMPHEASHCAACRKDLRKQRNTSWMEQARCAGVDKLDWFEEEDTLLIKLAISICNDCPVRAECLQMAEDESIYFGVWGGLTPDQRSTLRNRRGNSVSFISKPVQVKVTEDQTTKVYADSDLGRCRHCGAWGITARMSEGLCNFCARRSAIV